MIVNKEDAKKQVSIIIPVYNEESKIGKTLDILMSSAGLQNIDYEIIVVDDASKDNTAEIVRKYDIRLIQHEQNRGYGAALKTGIREARHNIIAMSDGDGSYPVDQIPELVGFINGYDMVVGARSYAKLPLIRRPAKWFLNKYANYLVKSSIPDINSGLRVFRKEIFERFKSILPSGFSFTTTLTLALLSNDYKIKYITIDYFKRGGKSKIRPIRDTINFFSLITRISLYFNPLRVFMPLALLLLCMGIIFISYEIFIIKNITDSTIILFLWGMQFGVMGLLADMISRLRRDW